MKLADRLQSRVHLERTTSTREKSMKMASRVVEAKLITKSLVMNTMELGLKASFMGLVSI